MDHYILTIGLSQKVLPYVQEELARTEVTLYAADDMQSAARQLDRRSFSLIVADLHATLWEEQVELVAALRRTGFVPILALTDYQAEDNAVSTMDLNVDVCQPWNIPPRLLAKQVRNILIRFTDYGRYHKPEDDVPFQRGDISIDPQKRMAYVRGRPVQLRPREFALLKYFMRNPNIVLTAEMICERAWGHDDGRDVGKAIYNLRQKIEPDPANPIYFLTEYRVGYRFTAYCSETCDEKESKRKVRGK